MAERFHKRARRAKTVFNKATAGQKCHTGAQKIWVKSISELKKSIDSAIASQTSSFRFLSSSCSSNLTPDEQSTLTDFQLTRILMIFFGRRTTKF